MLQVCPYLWHNFLLQAWKSSPRISPVHQERPLWVRQPGLEKLRCLDQKPVVFGRCAGPRKAPNRISPWDLSHHSDATDGGFIVPRPDALMKDKRIWKNQNCRSDSSGRTRTTTSGITTVNGGLTSHFIILITRPSESVFRFTLETNRQLANCVTSCFYNGQEKHSKTS